MVTACSLNDDEGPNQQLVILPIDSVQVPDTLVFNKEEKISISYTKPGDCYNFYDFQIENRDSTNFIGVINTVTSGLACDSTATVDKKDLKFTVRRESNYIFKFYQGADANGESIYLTKSVPVKRQ